MSHYNMIKSGYLDECKIANFHTVKNMELSGLGNHREVYFLGENGDGKTLILQGIVYALKYRYIKEGLTPSEVSKALDLIQNPRTEFSAKNNLGLPFNVLAAHVLARIEAEPKRYLEPKPLLYNVYGPVFAYGVYRGLSSVDASKTHGFMSLFEGRPLQDPATWLSKLYTKGLEGSATLKLETAKTLLRQLLDEDLDIEVNGDGVVYHERGTALSLDQLSEGYRSVMTWVFDLLANLSQSQPEVSDTKDYQGIVLVDEIGLHLHPKWEIKIVSQLRKWFPGLQFFFTTHSPITVMGASDDAIFFKVHKERGETKISEAYIAHDMRRLMANGLITSPLFDLESAHMRALGDEEPDTRKSWLHSQIAEAIHEEVQDMKAQGKLYISPKTIKDMIQKELTKHKASSK